MTKRRHTETGSAEAKLRAVVAPRVRMITWIDAAALGARLVAMLFLAKLVGDLVVLGTLSWTTLLLGSVQLLVSMTLAIVSARLVSRAEIEASNTVLDWFLRFGARSDIENVQAMDAGDLANRISRQPGSAARAVVSVRLGKSMSAMGAVMALALMAALSWQAALLLLLTMPIMVMFFIIVGNLTKAKASAQEEALQSLSGAFAEKVRCLPTIVGCDATEDETQRLAAVLHDYRDRSSQLLKVAFLNSAVLDFFSSLSIAMLAIFLGLGHLGLVAFPGFNGLSLATTLGVLVLAPEVYQPLRRFSELYHLAAEGDEALQALEPIASAPPKSDLRLPMNAVGARGLVLANGATVGDWDLPDVGLIVVTGPSGSGKTTLLRTLAGVQKPKAGQVFRSSGDAAWVATDAWLPEDLLREHLIDDEAAWLESLWLTDDARFRTQADDIDLSAGGVSGGQRVRLALAHSLAKGAPLLFVDEPTAKLDADSAAAVRRALTEAAQSKLVIAATHDPDLIAMANGRFALEEKAEVVA